MKKKLVSIIIPVFNSESYIAQCIESVIAVTLRKEIIVINDGSTDQSLEIIQQYADQCAEIIVIDQNNQGQAAARNSGIKIAKGSYLAFVDSDDFIDAESFEKLVHQASKGKLDVLYGNGFISKNGLDKSIRRNPSIEIPVTHGPSFMTKMIHHKNYNPLFWLAIYDRSFLINYNIYFDPSLRISEDGVFTLKVLLNANSCAYTNISFYSYQIRSDSLSNKSLQGKDILMANEVLKRSIELLHHHKANITQPITNEALGIYFQLCKSAAKLSKHDPIYPLVLQAIYAPDTISFLKRQTLPLKKRLYLFTIMINFNLFKWLRKFA